MLFGSAISDMRTWVALPLEVSLSKVSVATQVEELCLFSSRIGIAQRYIEILDYTLLLQVRHP